MVICMCAFNANEDLRSDCQKTYTNNCHVVTRVSDSSENYKCVKYKKLKYKNVMKHLCFSHLGMNGLE